MRSSLVSHQIPELRVARYGQRQLSALRSWIPAKPFQQQSKKFAVIRSERRGLFDGTLREALFSGLTIPTALQKGVAANWGAA